MYKVMLSAGEASGDLHGAGIAAALKDITGDIKMFGMGGSEMRKAGVDILYDLADYGVMGFVEVVRNLPKMFKLRDDLVEVMKKEKPDILVIIDYPDFNLRLAKCAKALGISVFSYIPPSAWAWRKGRAQSVAKLADKIAAIFPFETEVYRQAGANIEFVGNPLIDIVKPQMNVDAAKKFFNVEPGKRVIILLPGSRKQEIAKLLPVMLDSAEKIAWHNDDVQFFLPLASTISEEIIRDMLNKYKVQVQITRAYTYDLMHLADSAIAASGTVTLEAALLGLPAVVVYKMEPISYFIARRLVNLPNVSLPNIIMGKRIIPELLQSAVNADNVEDEVMRIMRGSEAGGKIREELKRLREKLGSPGAVNRVAQLILQTIQEAHGRV